MLSVLLVMCLILEILAVHCALSVFDFWIHGVNHNFPLQDTPADISPLQRTAFTVAETVSLHP
jgi:hypothetical protein